MSLTENLLGEILVTGEEDRHLEGSQESFSALKCMNSGGILVHIASM